MVEEEKEEAGTEKEEKKEGEEWGGKGRGHNHRSSPQEKTNMKATWGKEISG